MDEFGESYESESSFDSGMDLGGSESYESFDSPDLSFTESEPLSEGLDEAPLEDYSAGSEDLSFDETPALEDYSSDTAELPFDETPPLEDYSSDTAELSFDEAAPLEDYSSDMAELPFDETPPLEDYSSDTDEVSFDETAPLDDFSSDTEELPFDEVSPLENPDMVPNDISEEMDTLDAVEEDPSAMLDKAPEEDMSYFEDESLEDASPDETTDLPEELPLEETVPETEEIPESSDDFEELPFDETVPETDEIPESADSFDETVSETEEVTEPSDSFDEIVPESEEIPESSDDFEELPFDETVPESDEVTDTADDMAETETVEPEEDNNGLETYDYETAPETLDNVNPESSGELAPSDNPYSDAWEQFSEEVNEGDQAADWDSLENEPFAAEETEDLELSDTSDETNESIEPSDTFENEQAPEFDEITDDQVEPELAEIQENEAEPEQAEMPENESDPELAETTENVEESHEPAKNLSEYLNNHNYSPEDYETYSKDPEWRDLMRKEYPDTELPPLSEQDAKNNLSAYMNEHNWGIEDYAEYSQDPEWRKLHEVAFPDDVLDPIDREDNLGEWHDVNPEISFKDNLEAVNPEFDESRPETFNNCQRCVPTYEMRKRGYDVTAELYDDYDDYLSYHPYDVWENPEVLDTTGTGKENIEQAMREWGDGSRAQVVVTWDGIDEGHTFIAEQRGGKTVFIDPQTGDSDYSKCFEDVALGETTFCRIDNLQPSSHILDCCKEVKK